MPKGVLLDMPPGECVFVGDGPSDELGGAGRLGIRAVLLAVPGEETFYRERDREIRAGFRGERIGSLSDLPDRLGVA